MIGRMQRWLPVASLAVGIFLMLEMSGMKMTTPVEACGFVTHALIAYRGLEYYFQGVDPNYAVLLKQNSGALQAGAPAPDWLYQCGKDPGAGEEMHWAPFQIAAVNYIRKKYTRPWNKDAQKLIAFLFGAVSHYIADMNWHGLNGVPDAYSMIKAVGVQDFQCSGDLCGTAHTACDVGGEFVASYEANLNFMELSRLWEVPVQDLVEILKGLNHNVNATDVIACDMLFFIGQVAIKYFGPFLFANQTTKAPYLVQNYIDLPLGGVDDMAIWSTFMWNRLADWLDNGPPAIAPRHLEEDTIGPLDQQLYDFINELSFLTASPLFTSTQEGRVTLMKFTGGSMTLLQFVTHVRAMLLKTRTKPGPMLQKALKAAVQSAQSVSTGNLVTWMDQLTQWLTPGLPRETKTYSYPIPEPVAYFGKSVAVGDFDQDGKDDLVMGSPGHGTLGKGQQGHALIMYGNGVSREIAPGHIFSRFGASSAVVDLNADGVDDLAIASPTFGAWNSTGMTEPDYNFYNGRVDVYFGQVGVGLATTPSYSITTSNGLMFMGSALSSGDLNGDGIMDLLIGSHYDGTSKAQAGTLSTFISSSSRTAGTVVDVLTADQTLSGAAMGDLFGTHSLVVQTSTDRLLLVGSPGYNQGSAAVGRLYAYVLSAAGQATLTPKFTITGDGQSDATGTKFAYGRPRSTGESLLALASPQAGSGLLYEQAGWVTLFSIESLTGDHALSSLNAITTLVGNQRLSRLGSAMLFADFNNDGLDELVVSEPLLNSRTGRETGAVFVLAGGSSWPTGNVTLLHQSAGWEAGSKDAGSRFGEALALANVDGTGLKLVVAAPRTQVNKQEMAGQVHLFDVSL